MGKGFAKQKKQMRKMQEQFAQMQEDIEGKEAIGIAGNGLVTVTLNGSQEMTKVMINPECVDPEDVEGLEDLIKQAHNDALKNLQESMPSMPNVPNMPGLGL
jgi:nucleoid-associated protein EbfC